MHRPLNWVQWLSLLTALAVAVILPILVIQGRDAARSRDQGLRTFLCYFEQAALHPQHGPKPTAAQQRVIVNFFDGIMVKLRQPACLK